MHFLCISGRSPCTLLPLKFSHTRQTPTECGDLMILHRFRRPILKGVRQPWTNICDFCVCMFPEHFLSRFWGLGLDVLVSRSRDFGVRGIAKAHLLQFPRACDFIVTFDFVRVAPEITLPWGQASNVMISCGGSGVPQIQSNHSMGGNLPGSGSHSSVLITQY